MGQSAAGMTDGPWVVITGIIKSDKSLRWCAVS